MKNKAAVIELCIVLALLVVGICSLFRFSPGECICVSLFGRFELRNIDKVIISADGKEWTITDPNLIEQLCDETRVAEHINPCTRDGRKIDLYSGDRLVRSMIWGTCCDQIEVYKPSIIHWVIGGIGTESGSISMSEELLAKLNAVIKSGG